ncbi:MAG: hypothetical protein HY465_00070 [Deltaproteobacteria bacterium]|nr:hypothetical protein [Deltaproteobacteria bacterium]
MVRIIGVLGARPPAAKWLASLKREVRRLSRHHVCLPLETERRTLKNTVLCLKLTDIEALVVHGRHRQALLPFLSRLDAAARRAARIDLVVRHGREFIGIALPKPSASPRELAQALFTQQRTKKS